MAATTRARRVPRTAVVVAVLLLLSGLIAARAASAQSAGLGRTGARPKVLFVRAGHLTSGLQCCDPTDGAASDVTDTGGKSDGYGRLAQLLVDNGFDVAQVQETGASTGADRAQTSHVDLMKLELLPYKVLVLGSNNAQDYTESDRQAVADFVEGGGGVLFISDGNWGFAPGAAPASDNILLEQFGVEMMQDNGDPEGHRKPSATTEYPADSPDIPESSSPLFNGVASFGGFGTSTCRVTSAATILVPATVATKENTPDLSEGTKAPPNRLTDGALVTFERGSGRGLCLNDRNQFSNPGLQDQTRSHDQLATNVFNWLADR